MWQGSAESRRRCGTGEPRPGVERLAAAMWQGRAESRRRCGRGEPSPGADVAGVSPARAQEDDFVLTVATNVETSSQAQPAEATCKLYHAIVAALKGGDDPQCSFAVPRRFIGTCSCPNALLS